MEILFVLVNGFLLGKNVRQISAQDIAETMVGYSAFLFDQYA